MLYITMWSCIVTDYQYVGPIYLSKKQMEFLKDLFNFIWERKKWMLAPLVIILLLLGILIIIGGNSVIAPFIYSIF